MSAVFHLTGVSAMWASLDTNAPVRKLFSVQI